MKYIFIVNPVSGGHEIAKVYISYLKKYCKENNIKYAIYETEYRGHATKIANNEAKKNTEVRIYGFGGDGTLHEIVEGVVGFDKVEIGIFPFGSGNDYIRDFSVNEALFRNVEAQIHGLSRKVDVIKSENGRYALNQCALGLDAKVAMEMAKFRNLPFVSGSMAYNMSVAKCVFSHFGVPMDVIIDDNRKISGEFMMALVANGRFYGGGYKGAPEAKLDDGLLDIVLVKKISRIKFAKVIGIYKKGEHLQNENLKDILLYTRCKKIKIKTGRETVVAFDGECSKVRSASLEIMASAINFIVPQVSKLNPFSKKDNKALEFATV